jgi:predicted metal-dependent phosphotriesterase family hydrolase
MHEHLLVDIRPPSKRTPADLGPELRLDTVWAINYGTVLSGRNYQLDDAELATAEVQRMISHDICYKTRLVAFGGHGYGHIFANVVPMMRRRGFSDAEIQALVVDNPRRLLTVV